MIDKKAYISVIIFLILFIPVSLSFGIKTEFGFYGIKIGMPLDEINAIAAQNVNLKIDESRFFGKINDITPFIIKMTFFPYINNIYIQLYSNITYSITIQLNENYFDFFSITEKLEDKYGPSKIKTSKIIIWENLTTSYTNFPGLTNNIKLQLEYPSTIKVFDYEIMKKLHLDLNIIKLTNVSIVESNKQKILNEL